MDLPEVYPGREELRLIFVKMKLLGLWSDYVFGGYATTDEATQEKSYNNFRAAVLYRSERTNIWNT